MSSELSSTVYYVYLNFRNERGIPLGAERTGSWIESVRLAISLHGVRGDIKGREVIRIGRL